MRRVALAIVVLFVAAAILYWQVHLKKSAPKNAITQIEQPDFIASNLRSVDFNLQGNIASRVTAKHMEHFNRSNMTYFTQPIYFLYSEKDNTEWKIQALEGSLNKVTNKVVLQKNVIINSISPTEPTTTLKTSRLELNLNTMIMTSNRNILIQGEDFSITGKGLYADINSHQVELTSQVEGTYDSN